MEEEDLSSNSGPSGRESALCIICCHQFHPYTVRDVDNIVSNTQSEKKQRFEKFIKLVDGDGRLLEDGIPLKLAQFVCNDCMNIVEQSVKSKEQVDKEEANVRKLQIELLQSMRKLNNQVGVFQDNLKDVHKQVKDSEQSDGEIPGNVSKFHDRIGQVLQHWKTIQSTLESKVKVSSSDNSSNQKIQKQAMSQKKKWSSRDKVLSCDADEKSHVSKKDSLRKRKHEKEDNDDDKSSIGVHETPPPRKRKTQSDGRKQCKEDIIIGGRRPGQTKLNKDHPGKILAAHCALCLKKNVFYKPRILDSVIRHSVLCHRALVEGKLEISIDDEVTCSLCSQKMLAKDYAVHLHIEVSKKYTREHCSQKYHCEHCDINLTESQHKMHKGLHDPKKEYLDRLKRLKETWKNNFKCDVCCQHFVDKEKFDRHVENRKCKARYECTACRSLFKNEKTFQKHVASCKLDRTKMMYVCPDCPLQLTSEGEMEAHFRTQHHNEIPGDIKNMLALVKARTQEKRVKSGQIRKHCCFVCGEAFLCAAAASECASMCTMTHAKLFTPNDDEEETVPETMTKKQKGTKGVEHNDKAKSSQEGNLSVVTCDLCEHKIAKHRAIRHLASCHFQHILCKGRTDSITCSDCEETMSAVKYAAHRHADVYDGLWYRSCRRTVPCYGCGIYLTEIINKYHKVAHMTKEKYEDEGRPLLGDLLAREWKHSEEKCDSREKVKEETQLRHDKTHSKPLRYTHFTCDLCHTSCTVKAITAHLGKCHCKWMLSRWKPEQMLKCNSCEKSILFEEYAVHMQNELTRMSPGNEHAQPELCDICHTRFGQSDYHWHKVGHLDKQQIITADTYYKKVVADRKLDQKRRAAASVGRKRGAKLIMLKDTTPNDEAIVRRPRRLINKEFIQAKPAKRSETCDLCKRPVNVYKMFQHLYHCQDYLLTNEVERKKITCTGCRKLIPSHKYAVHRQVEIIKSYTIRNIYHTAHCETCKIDVTKRNLEFHKKTHELQEKLMKLKPSKRRDAAVGYTKNLKSDDEEETAPEPRKKKQKRTNEAETNDKKNSSQEGIQKGEGTLSLAVICDLCKLNVGKSNAIQHLASCHLNVLTGRIKRDQVTCSGCQETMPACDYAAHRQAETAKKTEKTCIHTFRCKKCKIHLAKKNFKYHGVAHMTRKQFQDEGRPLLSVLVAKEFKHFEEACGSKQLKRDGEVVCDQKQTKKKKAPTQSGEYNDQRKSSQEGVKKEEETLLVVTCDLCKLNMIKRKDAIRHLAHCHLNVLRGLLKRDNVTCSHCQETIPADAYSVHRQSELAIGTRRLLRQTSYCKGCEIPLAKKNFKYHGVAHMTRKQFQDEGQPRLSVLVAKDLKFFEEACGNKKRNQKKISSDNNCNQEGVKRGEGTLIAVICDLCEHKIGKGYAIPHLASCHLNVLTGRIKRDQVTCSGCQETMPACDYAAHRQAETAKKTEKTCIHTFSCKKCKISPLAKMNFKYHEVAHMSRKQFEEEGKPALRDLVQREMKQVEKIKKFKRGGNVKEPEEITFVCGMCHTNTSTASGMHQHYWEAHGLDIPIMEREIDKELESTDAEKIKHRCNVCFLCGQSFVCPAAASECVDMCMDRVL